MRFLKFLLCLLTAFATAVSLQNTTAAVSTSASSAILINADTMTVLYEKNADEQRAIASTTKIMTSILTIEAGNLDRKFTVDRYAIKVEGTSMGLREGDIVTRRALCYGMLLPSGNDAANAAAVSVSGSIESFAELMNEKAGEIGMTSTHFVTPSGLDADGHVSTARDMAILTAYAMENSIFSEICALSSAQVEFGNPPYLRRLSNSNKLLYQYDGCNGVKTGFTDNARRCLVSSASRNGVNLIAVTLNDGNDWVDHSAMLDYGFSVVSMREIPIDTSSLLCNVVGGTSEKVGLLPDKSPALPLTADEAQRISVKIYIVPFLYSGFPKGTEAGCVEIYLDNKLILDEKLITVGKSEKMNPALNVVEQILQFIGRLL